MEAAPDPPPAENRNRFILRRTLSAISWIHALWSSALGALFSEIAAVEPLYPPRLIVAHAALLSAAGWALWKPHWGAWILVFLAVAGSAFFVVQDLRFSCWESAIVDGMYLLFALGIFLAIKWPPVRS